MLFQQYYLHYHLQNQNQDWVKADLVFNFMIIQSWNYDALRSHCGSNSPEHMVLCCSHTTTTILFQFYDHRIMKLWWFNVPLRVVAAVMNIWCSVARLLLLLSFFNFMIIGSWNYDDLMSHCSNSSHEHMVLCCLLTTPTILFQFMIMIRS